MSSPDASGRHAEALRLISELSEGMGPRLCGSEGEGRAAAWLAEHCRAAGYEAEDDEFPAYSTFMVVYAPLTLAGAAALALGRWAPWLAAGVALLAALLIFVENLPIQVLSKLLKRRTSRNVIARREPEGVSEQDILILAHIDSAVVSDVRNLTLVRALFIGMVVSCLAIAAASSACALGAPAWCYWLGSPFALHLVVCSAIMIHQALRAQVVPGAGDNASGVAAALMAARELPGLKRSTVSFVGTGGEEAGLLGAVHLLEAGNFDSARTWIINADMVSEGTLRTGGVEGMVVPLRADPTLVGLAREVGETLGLRVPSEALRSMSTDTCAAVVRGYRAVTVSSTGGRWHQMSDTVSNVDPATVAHAADLIRGMVERLDAQSA